jgi:hypothetical protein
MTLSAKSDVCDGHVRTESCVLAKQNIDSRNGVKNLLDTSLPTFEDTPKQNARAHIMALLEYMSVNNVPPQLQLAVAKRSLKGNSVRSWYEPTSDTIENFQDFRKSLLSRYWNDNMQMKARMEIHQGK